MCEICGFYSGVAEDSDLLQYYAVLQGERFMTFSERLFKMSLKTNPAAACHVPEDQNPLI